MTRRSPPLLIGAHTSTTGGLYRALLEGKQIGASTIQLFTRNQKRWHHPPLSQEEIALFKKTKEDTNVSHLMSHDSYLINLGCPHIENLQKSRNAFREELIRCHQLEISYLNFHPGAALEASEEECLNTIIASLQEIIPLAEKGETRLLLETTAGQGSCVGYCFEHLAYILDALSNKMPLGVCIDTCHIFAAGYDIRTKKSLKDTLDLFDHIVGLEHLYALHINDSMKPFGSRKDRHASLGQGEIGIDCFQEIMLEPRLQKLPKYLETPEGPARWAQEIQLLQQFSQL